MPNVIVMRPLSSPRLEFYKAKTLSDFYEEVNLKLTINNLGRGIIMLFQNNPFDIPNLHYDNCTYNGTLYIVKATSSRLIDIEIEDISFILDDMIFNNNESM